MNASKAEITVDFAPKNIGDFAEMFQVISADTLLGELTCYGRLSALKATFCRYWWKYSSIPWRKVPLWRTGSKTTARWEHFRLLFLPPYSKWASCERRIGIKQCWVIFGCSSPSFRNVDLKLDLNQVKQYDNGFTVSVREDTLLRKSFVPILIEFQSSKVSKVHFKPPILLVH